MMMQRLVLLALLLVVCTLSVEAKPAFWKDAPPTHVQKALSVPEQHQQHVAPSSTATTKRLPQTAARRAPAAILHRYLTTVSTPKAALAAAAAPTAAFFLDGLLEILFPGHAPTPGPAPKNHSTEEPHNHTASATNATTPAPAVAPKHPKKKH